MLFRSMDREKVVEKSISLLKSYGYLVTTGVLTASDLGWPQTRSRHFLIASRIKQPIDVKYISEMLHNETKDVMWAIKDLLDLYGRDEIFDVVPKLTKENEKRVNWLFDNNSFELPNHIRPDCHKDGNTYPSVYGRMYPEKPAPTLTTGFQSPGRGRYVHPTQRRVLTAHEAARLQGFPDGFEFEASGKNLSRGMLQKWIGDAVPSILGYAAGIVAINSIAQY